MQQGASSFRAASAKVRESEALKNIQDAIKLYLEDVEAEAREKKV